MRVMISQPMKGLSAEEIRERRVAVVAKLEADGHEVVDTLLTDTPPENGSQALWYLGKALQAIAGVDAVYFMEGWEKARGCRIEYEACVAYGVTIINKGSFNAQTEKSGTMSVIEFIKMMQEAASLTIGKDMPRNETGALWGLRDADGIDCHIHLTAQGQISDKPTGIQVGFHVPPKV